MTYPRELLVLDVQIVMGIEGAAKTLPGFDCFEDLVAIVNLSHPNASHQ